MNGFPMAVSSPGELIKSKQSEPLKQRYKLSMNLGLKWPDGNWSEFYGPELH